VSYDLYAWPVDRPMTADEARVEIQDRAGRWAVGLGRDRRVEQFAREMQRLYPGLGSPVSEIPMEFDVHRNWVFMALPWSYVAGLVEAIAPIAFEAGLALFDPQRDEVALPAPFGTAPMGTDGIDQHERIAERAFDTLLHGGSIGEDGQPIDPAGDLERAGFKVMSPLGFEITPDIEDEVRADPTRVPGKVQTVELKAELLQQLEHGSSGAQQRALTLLGGWDPDPDIRAALRPRLDTNDVYVVGLAAMGLARQGVAGDLPALLEALRRMSPADGASPEAMVLPLTAALELARRAGPGAVADVQGRAREWRRPPGAPARPRGPVDDELDRLLGEG
jgi:hypothetical protein